MRPAQLTFDTGEVFQGMVPDWQDEVVFGEVVFNTGMVGYVECLTDPSYSGQLLTFTYPIIGNYGVPAATQWESNGIKARAMICSHAETFFSRQHAKIDILHWCREQGCVLMCGVDTRALTIFLRDKGVAAGAIIPKGCEAPIAFPDINSEHLVRQATCAQITEVGKGDKTIIAIDCGMKENIWRLLQKLPIAIKRVPFDYDFTDEDFDGVFISNGPGDPLVCQETISIVKNVMTKYPKKPIFGICLGSQIMGLAIGAKTYKLRFGHRSQNQPCLHVGTERCYLTSQNHGFAIEESTLPEDWKVTFRNLNDASVQGIAHQSNPYFSVQFHPEAAPGPIDTAWLFDEFYQMLYPGHLSMLRR